MGGDDDVVPVGTEVALFTHQVVREDAHNLYGFAAQAEREQELGQQRAAQQEFALMGEEIEEANRALVDLKQRRIRGAKVLRID